MSDAGSLLEVIGARISGGINKKAFVLLYKATDKPDVKEFHENCDAKGPTVTLLYGKYNTLFGGYTSKNWSSNKSRKVKDENAFLFAKYENAGAKCIFLPIKKKKAEIAITCDSNFGPTFGGGTLVNYDLQAFKKDGSTPKDKGSTPKDKESTPRDGEPTAKDKYMLLNGSLNVNSAYGVERSPGDVSGAQGLGTPEYDREQEKIKTKDINSGQMIVKRIEVYQVVDDELSEMWLPILEGEEFIRKKQKLIEMEPRPELNIKQYNILLIGVIGSGKSSFINTLSTVFSRKVAQVAPARQSETSVTSKVKAYVLKSEKGEPLNIRIFDVRGFEDERGYDDELELLLDGKLPIGYEFQDNPELNTIPEKKETKPMLDDKIHIVCFVHGNQNFETLTTQLNERFNSIKKTISRKDLPMVVVATKYDKICPKIARDIDHIYKSPKAENAALKTAAFYGVVTNHVFPVVNYVSEQETKDGIDKLALKALYEMCQLIEAHLGHHEDIVETPDDWTEREKLLPVLSNSTEKDAALVKIHDKLSELDNKKLLILMVGTVNCGSTPCHPLS
ncbi:uncharacterized protein LOC128554932 [Mercenaria mercenaria]|uniref:uncharacterized protein LOC128554932 n=1 Tax=Mercenaria mercenaria TaxID=6596 RepID=UPI00234E434A|nr:uncharacterized protein LOC128554932 [Mercenaria mercenaria]